VEIAQFDEAMNMLRNPRMIAATLVAGLFLGLSPLAEARTPKWEYLVVSAALNNRTLEQMLNARGLDGWELVGFTRKDVAVFKRAAK
jgi:hypothetical protein